MIVQINDIEHAEEPHGGRGACVVRQTVGLFLNILNTAFGIILVLLQRLRAVMTHGEVAKDILDFGTESRLGTITKEATVSTIEVNKILESQVDLSFRMHGITSSKFTLNSTVQLQHGTVTVSKETIIMGRGIREDDFSGNKLILVGYIGTGETGAIVAMHGKTAFGLIPLGSVTWMRSTGAQPKRG